MASIAEEFVAMAKEHGATGDTRSIAEAIDMLIDALKGSDNDTPETISAAVAELAPYIAPVPAGDVEITSNVAGADVVGYATVTVSVPAYLLAFDANGGTGTVSPMACAKGTTYTLPDDTGITAPTDKVFAGWGASSSATAEDVLSEYSATDDAVLYAVWSDAE